MKIVMVEPDGESGLAHFAHELAQALSAEGHDVHLITSTHYELAHLPHAYELKASMRLWSKHSNAQLGSLTRFARAWQRAGRGVRLTWEWARMTRAVLAERPDVVLFGEILFPHLGLLLWRLKMRGVRLAQICHEFAYQEREAGADLSGRISLRMAKLVYPLFDQIFFLSEATRRSFIERYSFEEARTASIPHGSQSIPRSADRTPFVLRGELGIAPQEPVVLFFGSIRPSKGVPDLIEAFARCRARDHARLVIAGQPTKFMSMEEIDAAIARHDLADRVVLRTGYIPLEDVAGYLGMSSCVVLPYRTATQSGVLHLAYEFGRPVIATNVGGLAEDVRQGISGYLVALGDIGGLASRIDDLVSDPVRAKVLGKAGSELSRTVYTWTNAARAITGRFAGPASQRRSHLEPNELISRLPSRSR
jgi:glycosyltransferase involved in cell wall biosynthesis